MATIPRSPKLTRTTITTSQDRQAEAFIEKAQLQRSNSTPYSTTLRIPPDLLKRVDAAAAKLHITRSAWIKSKLSQILNDEENPS